MRRASDLAAFQAYRSIPELGRFQGWSSMSETEALSFLTEMSEAPLASNGKRLLCNAINFHFGSSVPLDRPL